MGKNLTLGLFIFFVFAIFVSGCINNDSSESTSSGTVVQNVNSMSTPTNQIEERVTKELSDIAITINDLPNNWMVQGDPVITTNDYSSSFIYLGGSVGVPLNFYIHRYSSIDEAKSSYKNGKDSVTEVKVNELTIGDGGYAYQKIADTDLIFRNRDLIVTLHTYAYPPVSYTNLAPYARIVNDRIDE